ncbi:hypothetical protein FJTKL_11314 [Diaporthe vaccinii]|uniref:Uncharacterized protein n=1 Tax=Diaporthe vaccinii TaxID=105482 RepID=A0ABR4EHD2_9PEZI
MNCLMLRIRAFLVPPGIKINGSKHMSRGQEMANIPKLSSQAASSSRGPGGQSPDAPKVVQTIQVQCLSQALGDSDVHRASEKCDPKPNQATREILTPRLRKNKDPFPSSPCLSLGRKDYVKIVRIY